MEAILKFNLPEDNTDYRQAVHASDMCSFLWDFQNYLRNQWKHDGTDNIEVIYEKWHEMLNDNAIDLDQLIE